MACVYIYIGADARASSAATDRPEYVSAAIILLCVHHYQSMFGVRIIIISSSRVALAMTVALATIIAMAVARPHHCRRPLLRPGIRKCLGARAHNVGARLLQPAYAQALTGHAHVLRISSHSRRFLVQRRRETPWPRGRTAHVSHPTLPAANAPWRSRPPVAPVGARCRRLARP